VRWGFHRSYSDLQMQYFMRNYNLQRVIPYADDPLHAQKILGWNSVENCARTGHLDTMEISWPTCEVMGCADYPSLMGLICP
jgi:hypothetical protein